MTATDDTQPVVELRDLSVRYKLQSSAFSRRRVDLPAVDGVSLTLRRGETLGLVGQTGSGKSTIAQVIMGMVAPTSGTVVVAGRRLGEAEQPGALRRVVQVVLQDPYASLNPRMKVVDIIAEPLTSARRVHGARKARIRARVDELLGLVGLSRTKAESYPHQLSGGQRQRVSIARALAPEPELIVLDEPTSALDVSVRAQILNLLKRIQDQLGVAYLVISHDLVTVAYLATTVATMHQGRIVELGPTAGLYESPYHPYTVELLASTPSIGGSLTNMPSVPRPERPLPASACKFAPRCLLRDKLGGPDRCVDAEPALVEVVPGHLAACHFSDRAPELAREVRAAVGAAPQ
jgi:oligopeptide/dipeptide ABC transporter ATP-binding protein